MFIFRFTVQTFSSEHRVIEIYAKNYKEFAPINII